jgi:hypothetical protein
VGTGSWWMVNALGNRMTNQQPNGWEDGAIGSDNVNGLWVAQILPDYTVRFRQFTPAGQEASGGDWLPSLTTDAPASFKLDFLPGGMYVGEADHPGTKRIYINGHTTDGKWAVYCLSLSTDPLGRDAGRDFAAGKAVEGLAFSDGHFLTLEFYDDRAVVGKFSTKTADTPVYAKYTWYDPDPTGGNKESKGSPQGTVVVPKRMWPTWDVPRPPMTGTAPNIASRVRLYLGAASGDANLKWEAEYAGDEGTWFLDTFVGAGSATPPAATTFPAAESSGAVESLSGKTYIRGSDDVAVPGTDYWHTVGNSGEPAFKNGWSAQSEPVQFRKTPTGDVHIRGRAKLGTAATAIFTLPVGYRPSATLQSIAVAAGGDEPANVDITTAGDIIPSGLGAATLVSLTGLVFSTIA